MHLNRQINHRINSRQNLVLPSYIERVFFRNRPMSWQRARVLGTCVLCACVRLMCMCMTFEWTFHSVHCSMYYIKFYCRFFFLSSYAWHIALLKSHAIDYAQNVSFPGKNFQSFWSSDKSTSMWSFSKKTPLLSGSKIKTQKRCIRFRF